MGDGGKGVSAFGGAVHNLSEDSGSNNTSLTLDEFLLQGEHH